MASDPQPSRTCPAPIERLDTDGQRQAHAPRGRLRLTQPLQTTALTIAIFAGALIILGLLLHFQVLWLLLLLFAGLLVGVMLRGLSMGVHHRTGLSEGWSLAVVLIALILGFTALFYFAAPRIVDQIDEISQTIPKSIKSVQQYLSKYPWAQSLVQQAPGNMSQITGGPDLFRRITGVASNALGAITYGVVILFLGIYLAADPHSNLLGLVSLFPCRHRQRIYDVCIEAGETLRLWMVGQLVPMIVVGLLTGIGLWILGVPLAITIGLFAALLNFIPNFGPIISLVPAVLIAFAISPTTALYVVILMLGVQTLEGYVISPLVQKRMVMLPPALTITAQVILGLLVGGLGVALAAPFAAAMLIIVKMLYVEDILGEETELPTDPKPEDKAEDKAEPAPSS